MTGSRAEVSGSATVQPEPLIGSERLSGAVSLPGAQSLPAPMQSSAEMAYGDVLPEAALLRGATTAIAEEQRRTISDLWLDDVGAHLDAHGSDCRSEGIIQPHQAAERPHGTSAADEDAVVRGRHCPAQRISPKT